MSNYSIYGMYDFTARVCFVIAGFGVKHTKYAICNGTELDEDIDDEIMAALITCPRKHIQAARNLTEDQGRESVWLTKK